MGAARHGWQAKTMILTHIQRMPETFAQAAQLILKFSDCFSCRPPAVETPTFSQC